MVLSFYCKQWIVQLNFEGKISNGRIAKVLAEEELEVSKKTVWTTVSKYKAREMLSLSKDTLVATSSSSEVDFAPSS